MSSIFFNIMGITDNMQKIEIINDYIGGNCLKYFFMKYVDENLPQDRVIKWNKRFVSLNYLSYVVGEYLERIVPMSYEIKDGKNKQKEKDMIKLFFKKNNMADLYTNIAKTRKTNGDSYIYFYKDNENKIIRLKELDGQYMQIYTDKNRDILAYEFKRTISYNEEVSGSSTKEYEVKTLDEKYIFNKKGSFYYVNDQLEGSYLNDIDMKDIIPIIHFQFRKNETTFPYSEIPAEELLDICLELDRIESNIAYTNQSIGSGQMVVIDGLTDNENTGSGIGAVYYIDSKKSVLEKNKQATVSHIDIKNNLKSMFDERKNKIDMLFRKANLSPPDLQEKFASSDSGKVASLMGKDLKTELDKFYLEISEKFIPVFEFLYKMNGIKYNDTSFIVPDTDADNLTGAEKINMLGQKINILKAIYEIKDRIENNGEIISEQQIDEEVGKLENIELDSKELDIKNPKIDKTIIDKSNESSKIIKEGNKNDKKK